MKVKGLYIMRYSPEQFDRKSTSFYKVADLRKAFEDGDILEASVVKCDKDLNLEVQLTPNIFGTIPADEFEFSAEGKPVKSIAVLSKVGKTVKFKITTMDKIDGDYKITLSRKAAQQECFEEYISKLEPGQIIDARVTYVEYYGAFCDIGCGFTALLPIESICVSRIVNPSKELRGMRNIKAIVKSVENNRVTLSHKELLGTWEEEIAKFNVGDTVPGVARVIEDYGVFVELTPNLVGLADTYPDIESGDNVSVYIKAIIPEKMKIKLLIISKNDKANKHIHYDYKIPQSGVITDWKYSPECSVKKFETHIGE